MVTEWFEFSNGVNNLVHDKMTDDNLGILRMNKDEYIGKLTKLLRKLPKEENKT